MEKATTFEYRLRDEKLIEQIKRTAELAGASDWRKFGRQAIHKAVMHFIGLEPDLTTKEAAVELRVHPQTILRYIKQGRLPNTYWQTAKRPMIPHRDIQALKARTV